MNKFENLSAALDYIEQALRSGEDVTPAMCAEVCHYSLSNLQKMFGSVFDIGISDYISRRKLTLAARELIGSSATVLDIAVKYGYNSNEVFTRAFKRLWGVTPSAFRRNSRFSEIYPKLGEPRTVLDHKGEIIMTSKKNFDVSEFYDYICRHRECICICFDLVKLMYINETYGRAAGDLAIAKCLRNIDSERGEDMLALRIGGDEFVLITDLTDRQKAQALADKILSHNGETVSCGGEEIPVSMSMGFSAIPSSKICYDEIFGDFMIQTRGER